MRIRNPLLHTLILTGLLAFSSYVAAQKSGGNLQLIVQPEPPMLNSAINAMTPILYVNSKVYQGLLTYDPMFTPQPELAKAWDVSDDYRIYTFYLQENVKWHDGREFTADDVVFTIGTFTLQLSGIGRILLKDRLESIVALDKHTVRLTLKEPFPPLLLSFDVSTLPIIPRHLYEGTDYLSNPYNARPVGTGPFKFKEWKRGEYILMEKNQDYWRKGLPYLDALTFKIIPDAAFRAIAFEMGDVHVLRGGDIDFIDAKRLGALPGVTTSTKGWEMFAPMVSLKLNQRNAPFDNIKVRQAIMHALNRDMIVNNIFLGFGKPSTGAFSSVTKFHSDAIPKYEFDIKKARQLIKESGVDVAARTVRLVMFGYGSHWDRVEEYIKQNLEQIGFKVTIESGDAGTWSSKLSEWDFDMVLTYTYQYGDPALGVERLYVERNIVKGATNVNNQGYRNPELDRLWAQAAVAQENERAVLYAQIQQTLSEEVADVFLFEIYFPTLYRSNVKNLIRSPIGLNESFDSVYFE